MDIKNNKYIVYSVIVLLVAVVAFNFEEITGYAAKIDQPASITILNLKPGDVLNDRTVARLEIKNSFPNQRIRVYRERLDKFTGYSFKAENCKTIGGNTEYTCEADLYISSHELVDNERYYFRALARKGELEGNKAIFKFRS